MIANDKTLEKLFLLDFRNQSGFAFGLIFLICVSLILCYCLLFLFSYSYKKYRHWKMWRNYYKQYANMQSIYKNALWQIYKQPTHTMALDISNAIVSFLMSTHAIGHANVSTMGMHFGCYIQNWVIKCIEREIGDCRKIIAKYEKNIEKLKTKSNFLMYKQVYENSKKFLDFILKVDKTSNQEFAY